MAFHNLAKEVSTTTGTSSAVLSGAVTGYNTWEDAGVTNGETVRFGIHTFDTTEHRLTGSEVDTGVYTTADNTVTRATVISSTNAGSKIDLTGLSHVFIIAAAGDVGMSKSAVMWHDQSIKTTGNAFATAIDASAPYGHVVYQNTGANGDVWTNGFICDAGTYTLKILGSTDAGYGKLDVSIDGVSVATALDWYSASLTEGVVKSQASIVLTGGYHTLTGTVNGKNASSSGYTIALTKLWLLPASY